MSAPLNTGQTLSINSIPGQDVLRPITNSDSIFTFGDFRLEQSSESDNLISINKNSSFSTFSTLQNFSSSTFDASKILSTTVNELNPKTNDPQSYAYFGSFYTKVASAINSVIADYPYAILAYNNGANTILNYSNNLFTNTSSFSIPISALTNQGNVVFASGVTDDNTTTTLYNNANQFGIQLSGNTAITHTYRIINYNYSTGDTGTLNFTLEGIIFTGSTSASTSPVYIRPTVQRFGQYKKTIPHLEHQLLFDQTFLIPDADTGTFTNTTFTWPKSIDGFNPDTYGGTFSAYSTSILSSAQSVDDVKTDWMVRAMVPENFLELDTDGQIYRKLIAVYAEEFDTIKQYIDSIAFAHTVTYDGQENVPDKFLGKLSKLLGFKFTNAFDDADMFEYLASEDDDEKTFQDYNLELWKKILVNINWIYKKKGTRDALMFMFKLIGAPDSLINFNEFVYTINKSVVSELQSNNKINSDGYINYDASNIVFQEGGEGHGNGQAYINQWHPEFDPHKTLDNRKVVTGDTIVGGSENVVNTKEIELNINPASAMESDVKDWLAFGYGSWLWGSTGMSVSPYSVLPFSGMTVPFEWQIQDVYSVAPSSITAMTISQWIDFIYASNIDPTTRKTLGNGHTYIYTNLKKIYMTYMLWTNNQLSNRLTFEKLEKFLALIERNFYGYIPQLLPATTIFDGATIYRNTLFNRQKFVYPEGINRGSEFQKELPFQGELNIQTTQTIGIINDFEQPVVNGFSVSTRVDDVLVNNVSSFVVSPTVDTGMSLVVPSFNTVSVFREANTNNLSVPINFNGNIITFPTPVVAVTATTTN